VPTFSYGRNMLRDLDCGHVCRVRLGIAAVLLVASRLLSVLDNLSQGNVRGRSPKVHNRSTQFTLTHVYMFTLIYLTQVAS
jgi:hypothetical protein